MSPETPPQPIEVAFTVEEAEALMSFADVWLLGARRRSGHAGALLSACERVGKSLAVERGSGGRVGSEGR